MPLAIFVLSMAVLLAARSTYLLSSVTMSSCMIIVHRLPFGSGQNVEEGRDTTAFKIKGPRGKFTFSPACRNLNLVHTPPCKYICDSACSYG